MKKNKIDFSTRLKKAQKMWTKVKDTVQDQSFGNSVIEDGKYLAQLYRAELCESQSSGRLQVAWGYEILEGEFKGEKITNYDGVESEENLSFLGRNIGRLGFDIPDDLENELVSLLEKIQKKKLQCKIAVKTKGEFQNVYLQKVISNNESEDVENSETEETQEVELKKGDKVVLPTMGFTKFDFEDETYYVGKENEILSKIVD